MNSCRLSFRQIIRSAFLHEWIRTPSTCPRRHAVERRRNGRRYNPQSVRSPPARAGPLNDTDCGRGNYFRGFARCRGDALLYRRDLRSEPGRCVLGLLGNLAGSGAFGERSPRITFHQKLAFNFLAVVQSLSTRSLVDRRGIAEETVHDTGLRYRNMRCLLMSALVKSRHLQCTRRCPLTAVVTAGNVGPCLRQTRRCQSTRRSVSGASLIIHVLDPGSGLCLRTTSERCSC